MVYEFTLLLVHLYHLSGVQAQELIQLVEAYNWYVRINRHPDKDFLEDEDYWSDDFLWDDETKGPLTERYMKKYLELEAKDQQVAKIFRRYERVYRALEEVY